MNGLWNIVHDKKKEPFKLHSLIASRCIFHWAKCKVQRMIIMWINEHEQWTCSIFSIVSSLSCFICVYKPSKILAGSLAVSTSNQHKWEIHLLHKLNIISMCVYDVYFVLFRQKVRLFIGAKHLLPIQWMKRIKRVKVFFLASHNETLLVHSYTRHNVCYIPFDRDVVAVFFFLISFYLCLI